MNIEKIAKYTHIPDQDSPSLVVQIPENSQAVVFHILTNNFESLAHGCTTHKTVWFPCPAPILFRESGNELQMVILLSQEVFKIPPAVGSEFTLEIGTVAKAHNGPRLLA